MKKAILRTLVAASACGTLLSLPGSAAAQDCSSSNPADWPASDKPYFLFLVDTSGSMGACTDPEAAYCDGTNTGPATCAGGATPNACGWAPSRINDAKCALQQTITAFSGEVTFGLASFDAEVSGCGAAMACSTGAEATAGGTCGGTYVTSPTGCSTYSDDCSGTSDGGRILVPLAQGGTPSKPSDLLGWVDGQCGDVGGRSQELFAYGGTPLAKSMDWVQQYFSDAKTDGFDSPLVGTDRPCREVHVVLLSDGDPDSCDSGDARTEAKTMFDGIARDFGGGDVRSISVKTHVIGFGNEVDIGVLSQIAQMGQCGSTSPLAACPNSANPSRLVGDVNAVAAKNASELASAFATIVSEAILPEDCNNADDNCNGCVDEGYAHYQNTRSDCCSGDRATCLAAYASNPVASNLPCVLPSSIDDPSLWLCVDPGEQCDGEDNNGEGTVDEGYGDPVCCPTGDEICGNDVDENCDGIIEYTCGGCTPLMSGEVCNGQDDDCDGEIDEDVPDIPCGSSAAPFGPNCGGVQVCSAGAYQACDASGDIEICDALDNDCDGALNDGIAARTCAPAGATHYDTPTSHCKSGLEECGGTGWTGSCVGATGPTTEICNGIDDDCDGEVDEGTLPGVGVACGVGGFGCVKGTQVCVNGELGCTGGTQPQPEECDGFDNDCDGQIDEGILTDAPADAACWPLPGGACGSDPACSHDGLSWCPPTGGTCKGIGSLTSPCNLGTLTCAGASGWVCQGGAVPTPELCDGADNDCNGAFDDAPTDSELGQDCSSGVGECDPGVWQCTMGVLTCSGVLPSPEICDALDNDCDGTSDDGLPIGEACVMDDYDAALYPGERSQGECVPGRLQCDAMSGGQYRCATGIGPSPEVCDGKDNDCDGLIDEAGPAPDGIDGSIDPLDPQRTLGDDCGSDVGECQPGVLGCALGHVACLGGVSPQREICDCADNDCDGDVDEDAESDELALCSTGKTCVDAGDYCSCAEACGRGEFPCPTGASSCADLPRSGTDDEGRYCVPADPCENCGAVTARTVDGNALCGPTGTLNNAGLEVAECVCLGDQCGPPCQGIQCAEPGTACVPTGPAAGTCQQQGNCHYFGCAFGQACADKACVDNPCLPNPCGADEACKPNSSFTEARCVASCLDVSCDTGETCAEGACLPADPCGGSCSGDQACLETAPGEFTCGEARCTVCSDGRFCDPAIGCINHPCEGVVCPTEQACLVGECVDQALLMTVGATPGQAPSDPADPSDGASGEPSDGVGAGGADEAGGGGDGVASGDDGGCGCSTVGQDRLPSRLPALAGAGALLGLVLMRRRRRPVPVLALKGGVR